MRVLVVSGIWPPDVGGPASHAPEVADFLLARGHRVEVVTTADGCARASARIRCGSSPRSVPVGLRHLRAAALIARRAKANDVVYATGMLGRTTAGCAVARRPFVVKLTQDPAFERALRRGHYSRLARRLPAPACRARPRACCGARATSSSAAPRT